MKQIAVKLSDGAYAKLKRLARQGETNYATVVDAALLAYAPSDVSAASVVIPDEIQELIDAALAPVQTQLAELESRLAAMESGTPPVGAQGAQAAQPIAESQSEMESPEIAVEAASMGSGDNRDDAHGMEAGSDAQEDVPSHPVPAEPRCFADIPEDEKQHWRRVMLSWQQGGLSNPKISQRLWDEQRLGQYSAGKLAPMDRNRVKVEIDKIKGK